jgi:putative addiction module component (TIGR02574 family)
MTSTHTKAFQVLEAYVLQLPRPERVRLVERLLESLDEDSDVLDEWIAEAERRADAMERGEIRAIPLDEALAALKVR